MASPALTPCVRRLDFQLCIDSCTAAPSERAARPRLVCVGDPGVLCPDASRLAAGSPVAVR
eukprot:13918532-Alexandrium_andersonii.AAC.1